MHINSIFATFHQVSSVRTGQPFFITDKVQTWESFIQGDYKINMVKSYMYARVRLLFDPPGTSFAIDALKAQAQEFEWRLRELEEYELIPNT